MKMNISAVELFLDPNREPKTDEEPKKKDLACRRAEWNTKTAFKQACSPERPTAYVISSIDIEQLTKLDDLVVDKGVQNEEIELYRLLKGQDGIRLIRAKYGTTGHLKGGVKALLKRADKALLNPKAEGNDRLRACLIAVPEDQFRELWKEALQDDPAGSKDESPISLLAKVEVPKALAERFVGTCKKVELARKLIVLAKEDDNPVLILGDTGTGKELVAKCIHTFGPLRRGPFVPVNCGAIPSELLESELFGYIKGAFTGATRDKVGLWQSAQNGILFLDEIGELRLDHQTKILRAIQDHKVRRIGEQKETPVNARVIAATNRDLPSMVHSGQFREDLYYRLRWFVISTPRLQDNPENVALLAKAFWAKITGNSNWTLPPDIISELQTYRWPGNARELKSVLAHLYAVFHNIVPRHSLNAKHLRGVFRLLGQAAAIEPDELPADELSRHAVECLRHLLEAQDLILAFRNAFQRVLKSKTEPKALKNVHRTMRHHMLELERLCQQPLLFHGKSTFGIFEGLIEKLSHFDDLLFSVPVDAVTYWRSIIDDHLDSALDAVFHERDWLMKGV
ncbi:MAG: sigma-54-dependent Fis family transcriptional regulator [Planctomycetes bacterium]|nr:sigma-54-dependent Fis family transcriptional regulator [Planctomycetota bacterium]